RPCRGRQSPCKTYFYPRCCARPVCRQSHHHLRQNPHRRRGSIVTQKPIAVSGGGYTGLVAALRLAQAGPRGAPLEAGSALGGLAGGFSIENAPLEKAYHHLFRTDTSIIKLAEELGVGEQLQWHTSDTGLYYNGVLHPFRGAIDLARFKPLHFH